MKLIRQSVTTFTLLSSILGLAIAEDILYSDRRLDKRYIDSNGNWNMCKSGHETRL